jgi:hypothetical protein
MSIKTLAVVAAVIGGTVGFQNRADAQVMVYPSTGGYYPGVISTSYYSPYSGGYYNYPSVGLSATTPYLGGYYGSSYGWPYYGGYGGYYGGYSGSPYYGGYYTNYYRGGGRRWR